MFPPGKTIWACFQHVYNTLAFVYFFFLFFFWVKSMIIIKVKRESLKWSVKETGCQKSLQRLWKTPTKNPHPLWKSCSIIWFGQQLSSIFSSTRMFRSILPVLMIYWTWISLTAPLTLWKGFSSVSTGSWFSIKFALEQAILSSFSLGKWSYFPPLPPLHILHPSSLSGECCFMNPHFAC